MPWPIKKAHRAAHPDDLLRHVSRAVADTLDVADAATAPGIEPDAYLGRDLGMSSLAMVRLAGRLRKQIGAPLPFHTLFVSPDGSLIEDITIRDIVSFLRTHGHGSSQ